MNLEIKKSDTPHIILASASPRRKELLQSIGLNFEVIKPVVDEKSCDVTRLSPKDKTLTLAMFKGQKIAELYPDSLVIASDTLVVIGDEILEKPDDKNEAFEMLTKLQGKTHSVISSIAVFYHGQVELDALETLVTMKALSDEEIRQYVDTGEPLDKAGSYAIQGFGSILIERINGCYFNVVGMSLMLLDRLCKQLGIALIF